MLRICYFLKVKSLPAINCEADNLYCSSHSGFEGVNLLIVLLQIDVLPEVVPAVGHRCEVYMDGGVRSGASFFKALALGARAVFIGRPILWGYACGVSDIPQL